MKIVLPQKRKKISLAACLVVCLHKTQNVAYDSARNAHNKAQRNAENNKFYKNRAARVSLFDEPDFKISCCKSRKKMAEHKQMSGFKRPVQNKVNQMIEKSGKHTPPWTCKKTECHDKNRVAKKRQMVYPGHKVADKVI